MNSLTTFHLSLLTLIRSRTVVIVCALGSLAFCQLAQAVRPAPDGAYAGGNTAEGQNALFSLTTGTYNTAVGLFSLLSNETGSFNTAIGAGTLLANTRDENTAIGAGALLSNTTGFTNTATGAFALFNNTTGGDNTVNGDQALFSNTTGSQNTAIGFNALRYSTGSVNIGVGIAAGFNVTTANSVICIGSIGGQNIDSSCFIGNIFSNVQPVIGIDPDYVTIDSNGRLGRSNLNGSSRRFKHDIEPMDKASEVIFAFNPVSFRYNKEYDATQRIAFGLIAEDVAKVDPDLVGRNKQGEPDSVRYEQINAMLLNEFLKEHKKVQEQQTTIGQLKSNAAKQEATISELKKNLQSVVDRLKDQDSKIQRVSAQVELNDSVSRAVANKP